MARLSNFLPSGDSGADTQSASPIVCRLADRARGEIEAGLRLILATGSGPAGDDVVLDFLSTAIHRRLDINAMWVAERAGRIAWALLPSASPGRTMLLLSPGRFVRQTSPQAARLLVDAVCAHHRVRQFVLAQILLDPADRAVRDLYLDSGFELLAELVYLQRSILQPTAEPPPLPQDWKLSNWSDEQADLFGRTISRSYEQSLDCPGLTGRREIGDVIAGHQAAGLFDPSLWFVLSERGEGRGVLMLNPTTLGNGVELVYLGLSPEARGQGWGDHLMRVAMSETSRRNFSELSLAVDACNRPALSLYYRHGLKRVGSRTALVRDLAAIPSIHKLSPPVR